MRRFLAIFALVIVSSSACTSKSPRPSNTPGPNYRIIDTSPAKFDAMLRSYRGKPLVVNFWATWCVPCTTEMPRIVAASKKYAGKVRFLGVDVEDDAATASKFATRYGMKFTSIGDPHGDIRKTQTVLGLPVTRVYSSDGGNTFSSNGEIKADVLDQNIKETIAASRS